MTGAAREVSGHADTADNLVREADLIAACREGDQEAFAQLVNGNRRIAWAVCLQITGNSHDAEDALQDALTAAWQNIDRFRGGSRFSTWLYRIAANAALMTVRRRRDQATPDIPDLEDPASPISERTATADLVRRAIAELPEEFRVALVLREIGDLTYAEIAQHQRIPVQTVKSRISRGRARLAELLSA